MSIDKLLKADIFFNSIFYPCAMYFVYKFETKKLITLITQYSPFLAIIRISLSILLTIRIGYLSIEIYTNNVKADIYQNQNNLLTK
jgi:hypothetical protein